MESLKNMEQFDIHLLGYSDTVTQALVKGLGWDKADENVKNGGLQSTTLSPISKSSTPFLPSIPNLSFKSGRLPWQWMFEGAIEKPSESGEESIGDSSDLNSVMTDDSNTAELESDPEEENEIIARLQDMPADPNEADTTVAKAYIDDSII